MILNPDTQYTMQAKTFYGLESVLAQEIMELGGAEVKTGNRLVEFKGDLGFLYKANYSLRTALRILVPIHRFKARTEQNLYYQAKNFAWEDYIDIEQSFRIDSTVVSDFFSHSQFAALKLKDAIVDRLREKRGQRPDIDKDFPDVIINLFIGKDNIILSLDSSGEPLFKRGYRQATGPAPINEVLAAGLLRLAGWDGKGNFLDPMCGSGTLLIEAAMMALQIPAQLHRKQFAFMQWKGYDADLFEKIRETRMRRVQEFHGQIIGYDISPRSVQTAMKNIEFSDLEDYIQVEQQDFFESKKEHNPLLILFNPPYDERMAIGQKNFYRKIGNTLKTKHPNTYAWFITADLQAEKNVGLRPSRRIKLYNGKLETVLLKYEIFDLPQRLTQEEA
ncbi:MAG: class I SAM-dependent RNA methyltransferase [Weeksellaceae bacterium]|nr:class I SAM-dependent RNA methyltransferase [Weeksellaceae bacterium]